MWYRNLKININKNSFAAENGYDNTKTGNINPKSKEKNDTINSYPKYGNKFDLKTWKPVPIGTNYIIMTSDGKIDTLFSNHGILP